MLFFGIKIPTTKHEIMLHAMSLNLPTLLTALTAFTYPDSLGQLDQRVTDTAARQWRMRLRACVKAKGGHFEHKLSQ